MKAVSRVLGLTMATVMALTLALLAPSHADAATDSKRSFISSVATAAQAAQRQYGIPASALIAEAINDSNWGTSAAATKARNYFNTTCRATMTAAQFAKLAEAQVGKRYVLGAEVAISQTSPSKFDCSELVEWLYGRSGNRITDLAASQYNVTKAVSLDAPQVGDLVFLRNNPARSNGIGHVAVVTKKLSSGDWEIIEARGRAYGVVKTTLSYWKQRKYFAGLRRYDSFVLADDSGVALDADANAYQYGCVAITAGGETVRYSNYASIGNAFADRAAVLAGGGKYAAARDAMGNVSEFITQLAKADRGKDAGSYADALKALVKDYGLTDYDVVPFTVVLLSGGKGPKVTSLQYLLRQAGYPVKVTGSYDADTKAAVKKFQAAKKLESDGEAGPITLTTLAPEVKSGSSGDGVRALHALLANLGYQTNTGSSFKSTTTASVKAFQAAVGLSASGVATANTWAKLFMALDSSPVPTIAGTPAVDATLTATPGDWGEGVSLAYQWFRGATAIPDANQPAYVAQPTDVGQTLSVAVTGAKAPFTGVTRFSAPTAVVTTAKLSATPVPVISGEARIGQVLTAVTDGWGPGEVGFSYQWYRGKKAIKGATAKTYTTTASDAGAALKVVVIGSRPGYDPVRQTSAATPAIAKGQFTVPELKLSGSAKVGKKITVATGTWAAVKVSFSYQWLRGKSAIKGATKSTYKVAKADKGKTLTVVVKASASGFSSAEQRATTAKIS